MYASMSLTLMVTISTSYLYADFEEVQKSFSLVPIPMMRSASLAILFADRVPVTPAPPRLNSLSAGRVLLPAWVSPNGMLNSLQKALRASPASEYFTPPPQMTKGFFASAILAARRESAASSRQRRWL